MKNESLQETRLKVVEIFHSIQGEGANAGKSAILVRLANCNENCWYCDTDWSRGEEMTVSQILDKVKTFSNHENYADNLLIWTGGEPTLQLTEAILSNFSEFYNCIETNGTNPVPLGIQYISCSPKVGVDVLRKNFKRVNEFRYPIQVGDSLPEISELPPADNYFVSPVFGGEPKKRFEPVNENLEYAINFVKSHPKWRLSVQIHKFLNIR